MKVARDAKKNDPHRPQYHFVNAENTLNDPNGLCRWQDRWHLFYQARPPEDERLHWGHAVSDDLIQWQDLPYALHPGPENGCYSGTTLVEPNRVIAMYHGTELGNMVATSYDPLLLNWEKLTRGPVIPFAGGGATAREYGVFDPCIWKKDGAYYALSAGAQPFQPGGRHRAAEYLFRSTDLEQWEYLHPFIEGDRFTTVGDDGACPYFWPIGDRYVLLFFSHMSGGQYLLGDYDENRDKFLVDAHGLFNFGATFPGGVHAPTAAPDGDGGVVALFNMNPGRPTYTPDNYLRDFFGTTSLADDPAAGVPTRTIRDWDQIMTLPRRLTLHGRYELGIEPAGDIQALRYGHRPIARTVLPANEEVVLNGFEGNTIELELVIEPAQTSVIEVNVLRSSGREEFTRISYFHKRGFKFREPFPNDARSHHVMSTALSDPVRHESMLCLDTSNSSTLCDAICRPPESAPLLVEPGEPLRLRVFVDRSVVEVFANGRQCIAARVYPGRKDSTGVSVTARGQETVLLSASCWQMKSIYE